MTKSGQAATSHKPVKFEEALSFLVPYIGERNQRSNIVIEENEEDVDELTEIQNMDDEAVSPGINSSSSRGATPTPPSSVCSSGSMIGPKQRPHMATVLKNYFDKKTATPKQPKDHLKRFFEAMEETVRTFDPALQIEIKGKISQMVNDYELKNLHQQINGGQRVETPFAVPQTTPGSRNRHHHVMTGNRDNESGTTGQPSPSLLSRVNMEDFSPHNWDDSVHGFYNEKTYTEM